MKGRLTNGKATSRWGRGSALQRTKMLLDRNCEHICPIISVPRVRRDEEGMERRPNRGQALVIPNEEASRRQGCRQHVERTGDVRLGAEAQARRHRPEPVVGRQLRCLCGEATEVIVADTDYAC